MREHRGIRVARLLCVALVSVGVAAPAAPAAPWDDGDVFAGVANGRYRVYDDNGTFKEQITDVHGAGYTTGCAFSPLGDLYTTNISFGSVNRFAGSDPHTQLQNIPTGLQSPESIVFAADGTFYVGAVGGGINHYNAAGTQIGGTLAAGRRVDWMDLAADQKTMFFTTEGRGVHRHDMSTNAVLPDFAVLPGSAAAFALRLLPPGDGTGGLLVADQYDIKRLDGAGNVVQVYDAPNEHFWFALNLAPDGTTFWSGDVMTSNFYRLNIATGAVVAGPINTLTERGNSLFGICVKGEITAARAYKLTLDPPSADNLVGTEHTVIAHLTDQDGPLTDEPVLFAVTGVNPASGSDTTDTGGAATFTWTGANAGNDTVTACFDANHDQTCDEGEKTAIATKRWIPRIYEMTLTPPSADNDVGTDHTVTANLTDQLGPVGGKPILFAVTGANAASGSDTTDAGGDATFSWTGANAGNDTVTACFDENRDQTCDEGEKTAIATKRWIAVDRAGSFRCRASTLRVGASDPVVANPPYAPCRDDLAGLVRTTGLALASIAVRADAGESTTDVNMPDGTRPRPGDSASAKSQLVGLRIGFGLNVIEARVLRSSAAVTCVQKPGAPAAPAFSHDGEVVGLKVNGRALADTSNAVSVPLLIGTLHLNHRAAGPTEVRRRALWVQSGLGDIVVAESKAGVTDRPCTT